MLKFFGALEFFERLTGLLEIALELVHQQILLTLNHGLRNIYFRLSHNSINDRALSAHVVFLFDFFLNSLFEEILELVEVFITYFFCQFFVYIRNCALSDFFERNTEHSVFSSQLFVSVSGWEFCFNGEIGIRHFACNLLAKTFQECAFA